ncbi:uncharacterized protein LOC111370825 [Olea europaea var. sylvestris]|uniref:uncharacterized protein LOC111370825 n=1 Tax=Olea europaea var. sylvestris TaxID=158386 RepID=UPI000C1D6850|nr:uncharacterized protein LOC111370825 [Olea europaea var. sylvestris]XP_022848482.1 uncharacterized protein LOC111370825 [Olea europaea var. sylvestris]
MADVGKEIDVEAYYQSEASSGEKRKREGKLRSKVWEHFTKLIKEDGTCDKCQCNHCQKLFTCAGKSGTTHLLRHVSGGICPFFKQEKYKSPAPLNYPRTNGFSVPWKYNPGPAQQSADVEVELLPEGLTNLEHQAGNEIQDDNGVQKQTPSNGKLPQQSAVKPHPKVEPLMNELRACLAKLAEFTNVRIPTGSLTAAPVCAPDYSIAAALKCLNEMVDIPQSSEMYLDAFEILQDECQRECFICLPPEPRRRWMQRMLHRRHPLSYSSSI